MKEWLDNNTLATTRRFSTIYKLSTKAEAAVFRS